MKEITIISTSPPNPDAFGVGVIVVAAGLLTEMSRKFLDS